jgi:NAD(P)-dependent dehydrogenase (short-subunit alcohol dehydrogenase family)
MAGTVFVLGGSADIGRALIERYLAAGWQVVATYRRAGSLADLEGKPGFKSFFLDLDRRESIESVVEGMAKLGWRWNLFIAATGDLAPIGPFLQIDGEEWLRAIVNNGFLPCVVLQRLYPLRDTDGIVTAAFFAGGGVNNPFRNYSAYSASKLGLLKMCELLDDEVPDLKCFILGPGYTASKLHEATYAAGPKAGANLQKTLDFTKTPGTSMDDIFACLEWCRSQDRQVIGGRNISVVHDPWRDGGQELAAALRANPNLFKLRRNM